MMHLEQIKRSNSNFVVIQNQKKTKILKPAANELSHQIPLMNKLRNDIKEYFNIFTKDDL